MEVARWHAEIVEEPVGEGGVDFEDPSLAVTARGILATRLPPARSTPVTWRTSCHMIRRTLLRRLAAEGATVQSLLERSCAGTQQVAAPSGGGPTVRDSAA